MWVFWLITGLMFLCALGCVMPRLGSWRWRVGVGCCLFASSYIFYGLIGSARLLSEYNSPTAKAFRRTQVAFRQPMSQLKKSEFRYRLQIEQQPEQIAFQWKLLDNLATQAVQKGELNTAIEYWEQALERFPKGEDELKRQRVEESIKVVKRLVEETKKQGV